MVARRPLSSAWAPLLLVLLAAPQAEAWSDVAHQAIARVAAERIGNNAERRHRFMMGTAAKLEDSAAWAEAVIGERPETEAWHEITIPPNATELDMDRDCPVGDCLPTKIREQEGIVRLGFKEKPQIIEAFRYLVHLMGDLHQPLHAGYPPGSGGDETAVVYRGRQISLDAFWDEDIFDDADVDRLAERIRSRISADKAREWTRGTLRDWTWDTHLTAVRVAYGALPGGATKNLDGPYAEQARAAAEEQLAKAAVRLAFILDRIWPE